MFRLLIVVFASPLILAASIEQKIEIVRNIFTNFLSVSSVNIGVIAVPVRTMTKHSTATMSNCRIIKFN